MKTRKIVFFVPLAILALALIGGSGLLLRLFFLSGLVLLASYLWTVFTIRGISLTTAKPPEHCQVGDQFPWEVTVGNNTRLPKLWLRVEDNSDMPGLHSAGILNLSPLNSHGWQSTVHCSHRGKYQLGSVTVTATDPFGLFSQTRSLGEPRTLLVHPETLDLPLFKLSSFNDFGYGSGYQSINRVGPNASSVRDFVSGDSLHQIHWGSTAHTGRLMVKMFDADRSYSGAKTIWLILDMNQAAHLGEGKETTEEYGVTIAASLIRKYLEAGIRVGLLASGDRAYLFPPERGEDHLWQLLEALTLMKSTGEIPVDQLILQHMELFRDNTDVIIVTTSAATRLLDTTRKLRGRADSIVTILLDAASFGGERSTLDVARSLSLTGIQVYVARQGDELATALDNKFSLLYARYV